MEKTKCPYCGREMEYIVDGPSLIYKCTKCNYSEATTNATGINWDSNKYKLTICPNGSEPTIEQIKVVSAITAMNYIDSKKLLINGGEILEEEAVIIKQKSIMLKNVSIDYTISPEFPY